MRQFQDVEKRWSLLFNTSIGVDLRQAVKDEGDFDPCEDGLRSVCWKSYLLNGPLSKATWVRKSKESRSGYTSLRDHFLKYIENPNDIHSSTDPLADDENSPWSTLRQDESSREEIWQDVVRCNIDNYFFREPSTQKRLLDILFIWSKLNPDTGYRQGMHELLAPLLWVVYQDSIDVVSMTASKREEEGVDFMLTVLDSQYVEHDTFSLFCALMQTAKTFYEVGETRDSSVIVAHSERIHNDLLASVDPDLSIRLQVVGVVPQIYIIRWLRLLFGREFDFKDVLKLWDILFAEGLKLEIIDMACVALILRLRWQLIDADYTTAITTLTRLNMPKEGDSARAIIKDAAQLVKTKTPEAGADITQLRTGKRQYHNPLDEDVVPRVSTPSTRTHRRIKSQQASSPSPSPARFATPQKHLESLFSNVSNNFQKNAEGWSVQNVSKALRGAVGEARRNLEQLQTSHSRNSSMDFPRQSIESDPLGSATNEDLAVRLKQLEDRNKALAKMLEGAQETLRRWKSTNSQSESTEEDVFNTALARIQFVSVYLADSEISIPATSPVAEKNAESAMLESKTPPDEKGARANQKDQTTKAQTVAEKDVGSGERDPSKPDVVVSRARTPSTSPTRVIGTRPSLANSSFSFMLGEDRHRSSFVKSKPLPEERRQSDANPERHRKDSHESKSKPRLSVKDRKEQKPGNKIDSDDDGFTMSTLQ